MDTAQLARRYRHPGEQCWYESLLQLADRMVILLSRSCYRGRLIRTWVSMKLSTFQTYQTSIAHASLMSLWHSRKQTQDCIAPIAGRPEHLMCTLLACCCLLSFWEIAAIVKFIFPRLSFAFVCLQVLHTRGVLLDQMRPSSRWTQTSGAPKRCVKPLTARSK